MSYLTLPYGNPIDGMATTPLLSDNRPKGYIGSNKGLNKMPPARPLAKTGPYRRVVGSHLDNLLKAQQSPSPRRLGR
jgi:hypothetical protein